MATSIPVQIPATLRSECGGQSQLVVYAATVGEALLQLEQNYPAVYRSVCDETGTVRRHVHLFVNSDLVFGDNSFDTPLNSGDIFFIMPAVSGG
ncbi:MAG: MoaD/ThiS family protein [Planctomycetota bacterium]|nr:MoaD/ThiS family protein [Planctomycetota bacterium]MDA1164003.1 MoaD/ThiS family protein [Planctomycetota bacterium]